MARPPISSTSKSNSIMEPTPVLPGDSSTLTRPGMISDCSTLFIPISSPPTPAPSPRPDQGHFQSFSDPTIPKPQSPTDPFRLSRLEFASLEPASRRRYLAAFLHDCTPSELLFVSSTIAPLLKRDFLRELPPELALHILYFIDDAKTLARASQVSRYWRDLLTDEWLWKHMCGLYFGDNGFSPQVKRFPPPAEMVNHVGRSVFEDLQESPVVFEDPEKTWLTSRKGKSRRVVGSLPRVWDKDSALSPRSYPSIGDQEFSYKQHFKYSHMRMMNWRRGGRLLQAHRVPIINPDNGVITSVALDDEWVVVGLTNCRIHVFSAKTGVLSRTLIGHEQGVWAVNLISKGGYWAGGPQDSPISPSEGPRDARRRRSDDGVADLQRRMDRMSVGDPPSMTSDSSQNIDPVIPPSLRIALGLDGTYRNSFPQAPRAEDPSSSTGHLPDDQQDTNKPSDVCCASEGWGQPNALAVSGGSDKVLRVWDIKSGYCIYMLHGHTSTIRCVKVLHNRPIAVTGSRDATLRVWDIQRGRLLRVLHGHFQSVRCLDVCGNRVVSGSYDTTCRLWNVDTGECLRVLRGHYHQIYSVAFDGERIAAGGMDTTVRVWSASTGDCIALLQGHTALVCQLQLSPDMLATGGSDGRVITFSLSTYMAVRRIDAHDSSVTSLQFDRNFLVTGGNDGRVRLFETATGTYVRDLTEPCESVWRAVWRGDTLAIMCKRAGKTVMEIWTLKPRAES